MNGEERHREISLSIRWISVCCSHFDTFSFIINFNYVKCFDSICHKASTPNHFCNCSRSTLRAPRRRPYDAPAQYGCGKPCQKSCKKPFHCLHWNALRRCQHRATNTRGYRKCDSRHKYCSTVYRRQTATLTGIVKRNFSAKNYQEWQKLIARKDWKRFYCM